MRRVCVIASLSWVALWCASSFAKGVSPYLPLNISPEIEHHIEQVVALSSDVPLIKPYRAADIAQRVEIISDSHPRLAQRVNSYLERFKNSYGITHKALEINANNGSELALANARNQKVNEEYAISGAGIAYVNPYILASVGSTYSPDNKVSHQSTFVGLGWDVMQLDVGYREHWFSPFEDNAMLQSTHAKVSPSVTLSNSVPLTRFALRYELFYSILEPVDGIVLGDELFPGSPRLGGFHLSVNPFDFWSIGFNRTLQFGGGERDVTVGDFFGAFFDPAGRDNVGDVVTDDPNFEFGNQQASITTRLNLNWKMPFSIYFEHAGEDTVNESNFSLGNVANSLGVFVPYLTEDISLRIETVEFSDAWYVHHLYPDGYTNDGQFLGHWAASLREPGSQTSGSSLSLRSVWNVGSQALLDMRIRSVELDNTSTETYERGWQASVAYSHATQYGIIGVKAFYAKNPLGDNASQLSFFYRW